MQIKQKARGAMGGSGQADDMNNPSGGTSGQGNLGQGFGNQGNLGQGFDNNQGNLGQGFDNSGAFLAYCLLGDSRVADVRLQHVLRSNRIRGPCRCAHC